MNAGVLRNHNHVLQKCRKRLDKSLYVFYFVNNLNVSVIPPFLSLSVRV